MTTSCAVALFWDKKAGRMHVFDSFFPEIMYIRDVYTGCAAAKSASVLTTETL